MTWFDWNQLERDEKAQGFHRFFKEMVHFRRSHPLLGVNQFVSGNEITWHEGDWTNGESRFLAFSLHG